MAFGDSSSLAATITKVINQQSAAQGVAANSIGAGALSSAFKNISVGSGNTKNSTKGSTVIAGKGANVSAPQTNTTNITTNDPTLAYEAVQSAQQNVTDTTQAVLTSQSNALATIDDIVGATYAHDLEVASLSAPSASTAPAQSAAAAPAPVNNYYVTPSGDGTTADNSQVAPDNSQPVNSGGMSNTEKIVVAAGLGVIVLFGLYLVLK